MHSTHTTLPVTFVKLLAAQTLIRAESIRHRMGHLWEESWWGKWCAITRQMLFAKLLRAGRGDKPLYKCTIHTVHANWCRLIITSLHLRFLMSRWWCLKLSCREVVMYKGGKYTACILCVYIQMLIYSVFSHFKSLLIAHTKQLEEYYCMCSNYVKLCEMSRSSATYLNSLTNLQRQIGQLYTIKPLLTTKPPLAHCGFNNVMKLTLLFIKKQNRDNDISIC